MARMTEAEADALDELWTKTTPAIDTGKPGYFTQHMAHLVEVDELSSAWIRAKVDNTHQTPAQIIGALVRKEIQDAPEARPAS
ncbi:MAG: hypothetical protein LBG22_01315 [Treponema sp.]|jgi:hypothetical protein|nr:hypothetical protein [Treponema sp.]